MTQKSTLLDGIRILKAGMMSSDELLSTDSISSGKWIGGARARRSFSLLEEDSHDMTMTAEDQSLSPETSRRSLAQVFRIATRR